MRRLLFWLIMIPALVAVVVFALNNTAPVALDLWPFAILIEMPLFLALLLIFSGGVVVGGFVAWLSQGRVRGRLREQAYEGEVARRELAAERDRAQQLERELERLRAVMAERPDAHLPVAETLPPEKKTLHDAV